MGTVLWNDQCVLGIWRGDALWSLIWFVEPSESLYNEITEYEPPPIAAPSWSWASVSNPIRYRPLHPFSQHADREVELIKPFASILSISAVQPDPASFSNFIGKMILKGAVSKLTAQEADIVGCEVLLEPRPKGWWWQPKPDKTLDS